jgi:tRNA pseudouridine55 synthase
MVTGGLDGILVVDKPVDMTSAKVVSVVKNALQADKVGHAGTLDPFAEGVLICCINRATRLAGFLLRGPKKYVAKLRLGQETDTQDKTGKVIATVESVEYPQETIRTVFESFQGIVEQLPPIFSALKHRGIPLYRLARRGQPVQKPPRRVQIYDIAVREIELPDVCFEVSCSAGTYIRTLGSDIGKKLGCGGHLVALQRVESSGFKLDQAIPVSDLKDPAAIPLVVQKIIPLRDTLPDVPECRADDRSARKIRHGQKLNLIDLHGFNAAESKFEKGQYLKIVDRDDELIAIVVFTASKEHLKYACVFPK